jgi:hypothetical protein
MGESHHMAGWAQKLGITPQTFANRMAQHRSDPVAHPVIKVFAPAQDPLENLRKRRRRGPGKVAKKYQYTAGGKVFTHTADEWTDLLGISRNTFYSRIKAFTHDPRSYPLSWVFRCKPDAPFANPTTRRSTVPPMTAVQHAELMQALDEIDAGREPTLLTKPRIVFADPIPLAVPITPAGKVRDKAFDQPHHGHADEIEGEPATEPVKPKLAPVTVLDFDD